MSKRLKSGSPVHFNEYENLIRTLDNEFDNIMLVNLPNNAKFAVIYQALEANVFVYTEAPLARKVFEAESYRRHENHMMLCVAEDLRFSKAFRELKDKVTSNMKNPTVLNTGYGFSHHLASTITAFQQQDFVKINNHFITYIKTQNIKMFVHYGELSNGNDFVFITLDPKNNPLRNIADVILYDKHNAEGLNTISLEQKLAIDQNLNENEFLKDFVAFDKKEYKFHGQYYNFMTFLDYVESNKQKKAAYKFSNAYSDFYISKQIFLRQRLYFIPNTVFKFLFLFLKNIRRL